MRQGFEQYHLGSSRMGLASNYQLFDDAKAHPKKRDAEFEADVRLAMMKANRFPVYLTE